MKNLSKTIAAISMTLLTVGVMAQNESTVTPMNYKTPLVSKPYIKGPNQPFVHSNNGKKVAANTQSFEMAYWVDDAYAVGQTAYSITNLNSYFVDQVNGHFTKADTGAVGSPRKNYNLVTDAVVAFDTILDQGYNAYSAAPGSMTIDTLWVQCWYKNSSNTNDTLVFSIDSVTKSGYPTTSAYKTISVIMHKNMTFTYANPSGPITTKVSGLTLDSGFQAICIPNFKLPKSPKYCVFVSFLGSKADTFEVGFGFPEAQCNGGFYYANAFTTVGNTFTSKAPRTINVNSYVGGWQLYYSNGSVLLPGTDGTIFDGQNDPYNYEWNVCGGGGPGDTLFFYEQDYAIYSSVSFNDVTGISNINPSGLSVSQNYPNPFNRETIINYSLVRASDVTFTVYDITGREVTTTNYGNVSPGQYQINLDAKSFSPGIYFYTFNVNGSTVTKKMVITE